jgi:hypothetical protein
LNMNAEIAKEIGIESSFAEGFQVELFETAT